MKGIKKISATEARNRWFEFLNFVYFKEIPVIKLIPAKKASLKKPTELIEETFGFLKGRETCWPSEEEKVINREKRYLNRLWRNIT